MMASSTFLLITAVLASIGLARGQSCKTPSGEQGVCQELSQCQPLFVIINKKHRTPDETELVRNSFCGYNGMKPKVCCPQQRAPESCYTAEGSVGQCVDLYSCPTLLTLLNGPKPLAANVIERVRLSRCNGATEHSVCCGPNSPPSTEAPPEPGQCTPSSRLPDPTGGCCGIDVSGGNRIIGGISASLDQFPWLTLIEYRKDQKIKLLCGGALISSRYVLTAGHCVAGEVLRYGTPVNVRLGEYDTSSGPTDCVPVEGGGVDCAPEPVIMPIERTIPHPQYDPNDQRLRRNDIALIRLKSLAPYSDFIRPICLPTSDVTSSPGGEVKLYAAGWGATNDTTSSSEIKQYVDLPFKSMAECQHSYSVPRRSVQLWTKQLCAGGVKGKDSCKGDSGGPLMYERTVNDKNVYEVIGIVSFGPSPCGQDGVPGVYTKIYEYNDWIRGSIQP